MKQKSKKFGPRLTVSLTASDYDALNALAQKDEVSISWVMRRAVEEYLRSHRQTRARTLPQRVLRKPEGPVAGREQER